MNTADVFGSINAFIASLPPFVGAVLTFLAGWAVARGVQSLVPKLLVLLRFDRFSEKTGIKGFLEKGNLRYAPSRLMGILTYWFLMVIVLSNTVAVLDKGTAESISLWIRSAFPKAITAGIIVVIGIVVVTFLSNFFITVARNAAIHNPVLIGKVLKYVGYIIVVIMALEQFGLGQTIISSLLILLFAAVAFGTALAFGLGCKDLAKKYAEDFIRTLQEKERTKHGTDLEG